MRVQVLVPTPGEYRVRISPGSPEQGTVVGISSGGCGQGRGRAPIPQAAELVDPSS
ncbi:protein of unknown function [Methanoculleus bourgensis]|uniref:Uncharacterized protein n=1 Tax=Methanoculleus bourgensis TaxID=83986 RepID=A0A0X3BMQ5_9EURY|nr:protein of unknown function [Methanoculleus bourgensis]